MKHIGFVDFYISEWHANNYPAWIEEINRALGFDYKVSFAWAEQYVSPVDGVNTDEWCEKNSIERIDNIEELCEKSDVIVVLAPSNPEKHLEYAKKVLPFKKRTYIDKTFAPNYGEAKEIFEIGEKYGTPFFSTSALRYADELKNFTGAENITVNGGGRDFEEYIIHLAEMVTVLSKENFVKARVELQNETYVCTLLTEKSKEIKLNFKNGLPYGVTADVNGKEITCEVKSDFFKNLIADILKFFESGKLPFGKNKTLRVMQIRDLLLKAEKSNGKWVAL